MSFMSLRRMRRLFESYRRDGKVSPPVTHLPWRHSPKRQYRLGAFKRVDLDPPKVSAALTHIQGKAAASVFKDAYSTESLTAILVTMSREFARAHILATLSQTLGCIRQDSKGCAA